MGVFTLWIFTKKPWKMKKAFCFDYFSMSRSESKFFHVWFEFFPSYLSKKKEISETFLGLGLRPRPQKTFPRFPFFYFGNLGKTQIRRGKILLQTWHGKKSKQNTISLILWNKGTQEKTDNHFVFLKKLFRGKISDKQPFIYFKRYLIPLIILPLFWFCL